MEFRQKTFVIFSEEEYEKTQKLLFSKGYEWIHGDTVICSITPLSIPLDGYLDFPLVVNADTQGTIMMSRLKKEHIKRIVARELRKRKLERILKYDL